MLPVAPAGPARLLVAGAETSRDDAGERTVHGVGHELGEDAAGRGDEGARDDERNAVDDETRHRDGTSGERVQQ